MGGVRVPWQAGRPLPPATPYHHRLGWQFWFAAMSLSPRRHPGSAGCWRNCWRATMMYSRYWRRTPSPTSPRSTSGPCATATGSRCPRSAPSRATGGNASAWGPTCHRCRQGRLAVRSGESDPHFGRVYRSGKTGSGMGRGLLLGIRFVSFRPESEGLEETAGSLAPYDATLRFEVTSGFRFCHARSRVRTK